MFLQDSIGLLLDAVRTSNEDLAQTWKKSEQWATIEQLCSKSALISTGTAKRAGSQFSFCTGRDLKKSLKFTKYFILTVVFSGL